MKNVTVMDQPGTIVSFGGRKFKVKLTEGKYGSCHRCAFNHEETYCALSACRGPDGLGGTIYVHYEEIKDEN